MNTRWLLPRLLLLLIAGCVKAPPIETPELPVQAPEVWTTGEEVSSELDPEWWRTFGDEKLDSVVAEALATNYDLAIAAARLEQDRERGIAADVDPLDGVHLAGNAKGHL